MIKLENVTKSIEFRNKTLHILKGISFYLDKAELGVISGRSGAGKTTLLHIIAGLDTPTDGKCYIDERCISELNDQQRADFRLSNIGIVFQSFNFLMSLTIEENISVPAILKNSDRNLKNHIKNITDILGIGGLLDRYPNEVSGGELQRACIARAMINNPGIILADEPTGNLDKQNRETVLNSIKKIIDEYKVTVLMVTHDLDIERSANKIFHIDDGILTRI